MTSTRPPVVAVTVVFLAVVLYTSVTVRGNWTPWKSWSSCTKTCGNGTMERIRHCDSTDPCIGDKKQTAFCNTFPCTPSWTSWYGWSRCSRCEQPGTSTRYRYCVYGSTAYRAPYSKCEGNYTETKECTVPCGTLTQWGNWTTCYGCSGYGYTRRYRSCPTVCDSSLPTYETENCVPAAKFCMSTWGSWSSCDICSEECGWGKQTNTRVCRPIYNRNYTCTGNVTKRQQNCITTLCGDLNQECPGKADVVFVVDSSSSIRLQNWYYVRAFVATAAKLLDIGENKTRLSVVTFSEGAYLIFDLDTYFNKTTMMQRISCLPYMVGRTNTQAGLALARTRVLTTAGGERPDVPNIVVVITDGVSTIEPENTIPEANKLKEESNATVIVIGITDGINEEELRGIASVPDDVVYSSNFSTLASIAGEVAQKTCEAVEKEGGWMEWGNWSACSKDCNHGQRIRGRDCMPGFTCDGPAYELESCNNESCPVGPCGYRVDLALLMDSSSSIGEDQWEMIKGNVSDLLNQLDVSVNGTNVAMIQFSTWASIIFNLNAYTERDELISNIQSVSFEGGATNTQEALRLMIRGLLGRSSGGGRRGIPKVCVIITDGDSNIEPNNTVVEAQKAKHAGIYIIAVGATSNYNRTKLEEIAFDEFLVYSQENITEVAAQIAEIANLTCNQDPCIDDDWPKGHGHGRRGNVGFGRDRFSWKFWEKDSDSTGSDSSERSSKKKDSGSGEERKNKKQSKERDSSKSTESDGSSEESSEEDHRPHRHHGHHRSMCRGCGCRCACRHGSYETGSVWRWGYHLRDPWEARSSHDCCTEGWGKGDSKCHHHKHDHSDSDSSSEKDSDSKEHSKDKDDESDSSEHRPVEKKNKEKGSKEGKDKSGGSGSKKKPAEKKKVDKKTSKGKDDSEEEKKKKKASKGKDGSEEEEKKKKKKTSSSKGDSEEEKKKKKKAAKSSKKTGRAAKDKGKEKKKQRKSSKTPKSRRTKSKKSD